MLGRVERAGSPSGRPVTKGWVSSHFGWRTDPITGRKAFHDGIDFAGRYKSPVIAVASGIVTHSESRRGYGNIVQIKHPGGLSTRYAHNAKNTVSVGDKVERGEVIALMGSTGRSTGAHVHFEVMRGGEQLNPRDFIRAEN
ncbi:MAG: peptidoglycan DD-metalloendopeptidase family protein [Gammaproteobacteria bacterium]|nr:peptidoglycan DD-metalloendopeptidase family protein [Gammaproteobacteria bacterium]